MGRLDGKVAVVTGAASGIGNACARRFAAEGAAVAGLDLVAPAPGAWADVEATAPDHDARTLDVRDADAVGAAVAAVVERFGHVDVLVNAAGVSGGGTAVEIDEAEWDRVVDVNLKGTWIVSKEVVPHMVERGGGSVVNLASIEGIEGFQSQTAYNVSKGGVILLTRNMAIDFGHLGVRVNCLCPGLVDTPMTAVLHDPALRPIRDRFVDQHMLGRAGRPDEIAAAALFLASDDASFVTGASLVVDGGFTAGRRLVGPGETI